jgi:glycosyltransferase involved in cell wall biosynthesis
MKIVFIGQKGIPASSGGVERHVEELATRLVKEGHEVICYCRNHYTPKDLQEYKGVKLIHLPTIRTKHLDAIVYTLLATIDILFKKVDIIHYHAIGPSSLLWIPKILKRRAKIVSTFHSDDRKHQKWGWLAKICLGLGAFVSIRLSDKAITVSRVQKEKCRKEFGGNSIYIPNGVPIQEKVASNFIKEKWGLNSNDYILAVSRLIRLKGLHYLIEAYKSLETSKKLVIVGPVNYADKYIKYLKDLAKDNPNIIFTGEQKGKILAELYSNACLFVQSSETEGLSIALLEAMSYGLPVLVSDIPGNKEAVADIGFVFRNKSANDLQRKLKFLLDNPEIAEERKEKAREHVTLNYNWDKVVRKTINLYEQLLVKNLIKDFSRLINYQGREEEIKIN